jgi:hypothetical protein
MNDRPNAAELLAAVRQFLETEMLPSLTDARQRFQTLIAVNVLTIAERETLTEEAHLLEESHWLAALQGKTVTPPGNLPALRQEVRAGNDWLCQSIRAGKFDAEPEFGRLLRQLQTFVERKLEVANPRYLAALRGAAN